MRHREIRGAQERIGYELADHHAGVGTALGRNCLDVVANDHRMTVGRQPAIQVGSILATDEN